MDAPTSAIVLVRNTYAKGWRATVDGHATPVLPADYLLQGIPVGPGHHVIELAYHEPTIGEGLFGSAAALVALLGMAVVLASRKRRRRPAG